MATNPMKRREQNAFLIGFVIGLILVLVVGFLLFSMYNKTKAEFEKYKKAQEAKEIAVVVAKHEIKDDNEIKPEDLELRKVIVDMDTSYCYKSVNEVFLVDAPDGEKQETTSAMIARLDIPQGAILTKNFVEDSQNPVTNDLRLKEYNSVVLPSELEDGDVVDIRLTLPTGQDFVVLSKKNIIKCDETTIWMNVNEGEIQIMNSAMVEAWSIVGAKLYAIQYTDAGMQENAKLTYRPREDVVAWIETNENITDTAEGALAAQWNGSKSKDAREKYISPLEVEPEKADAAVESGFAEESATIRANRSDFIESLGE